MDRGIEATNATPDALGIVSILIEVPRLQDLSTSARPRKPGDRRRPVRAIRNVGGILVGFALGGWIVPSWSASQPSLVGPVTIAGVTATETAEEPTEASSEWTAPSVVLAGYILPGEGGREAP